MNKGQALRNDCEKAVENFCLKSSGGTFNVQSFDAGIGTAENTSLEGAIERCLPHLSPLVPKGFLYQRAFCSLSAAVKGSWCLALSSDVASNGRARHVPKMPTDGCTQRTKVHRTNGCEAVRKGSPCHSGRYQCGSGSPDKRTEWPNAPGDKPNPEVDCGCYAPPRDTADASIGEILNGAVVRNWRRCPRRAKGLSLVGGVPNATFENRHTPSPILSSFQPTQLPFTGVTVPSADPEPTSVHSRSSFAAVRAHAPVLVLGTSSVVLKP